MSIAEHRSGATAGVVHELALQLEQQPLWYELPLASGLAIDGEEDASQTTVQEIADVLSDALRKLGNGA
ncbi:MAG: hypothetical protein M3Y57_20840 [Acidobacteriota bacterium]|nr:hypothetical protein [Acidobacteriota bacterium]